MAQDDHGTVNILLVGVGTMSTILAVLFKELNSNLKIEVVELQESGAIESSNPWNNASTSHADLCELNYTPRPTDDSINIRKTVDISTMLEVSKQFWSHLVAKGTFGPPKIFINPIPHLSLVCGSEGIAYPKKRFGSLIRHHAFEAMTYSEDEATLVEWVPLMMPGRPADEAAATTRVEGGTNVNFGALTSRLPQHLARQLGAQVRCNQKVTHLRRTDNGWRVTVKDTRNGDDCEIQARFVFLGTDGDALPLLQPSGIPKGKDFGGFPVNSQWLRCDNPGIIKQHQVRVYSRAGVGSSLTSVPHLDTRAVDGKRSLLFGPYAGLSTKFLRHGSFLDLPLSVRPGSILPMLSVVRNNMDSARYLIGQIMQSPEQRLEALHKLYPEARAEDWHLEIAGQYVQITKRDPKEGGILQFGTELVAAHDDSIAALLGVSPGASVTVSIMLGLIERCFPKQVRSPEWNARSKEIFPARERELESDAKLYRNASSRYSEVLGLITKNDVQVPVNAE